MPSASLPQLFCHSLSGFHFLLTIPILRVAPPVSEHMQTSSPHENEIAEEKASHSCTRSGIRVGKTFAFGVVDDGVGHSVPGASYILKKAWISAAFACKSDATIPGFNFQR